MATRKLQLVSAPALDLTRVTRQLTMWTWDTTACATKTAAAVQSVVLEQGRLTIDGTPIARPAFTRDAVSWSQKTAGRFQSGVLHFTPDGLAVSGFVYDGADETAAVPTHVSGTTPPSVYTTQVAKTGSTGTPVPPTTPAGWEAGITLSIGYKPAPGGGMPVPVRTMDGVDITTFSALSVDPTTQNLQLTINFNPTIAQIGSQQAPDWPAAARIEFSWDGASFSGALQKYDATTSQPSQLSYAWQGTTPATSPAARAAAPAAARAAVAATTTPGLSLSDLATLTPDGADTIANNLLTQNMEWAVSDDWRTTFFGVQQPDFSDDPQRVALINQSLSWYQNRFGVAYIGWGVSKMTGQGAPSQPLSAAEQLKLKYYLYQGVSQEKDYTVQSQGVALSAFIQACNRLQDYINDTTSDWATQLYNSLTTSATINQMVNSFIATGTLTVLNRYTSLLNALQPSGQLAMQYHTHMTTRCLHQISDQVNLSDASQVGSWLPDVISQFIAEYTTESNDPTAGHVLCKMALDLQAAAKAAGGVSQLAEEMTNAICTAAGASLTAKASAAAKAFAANYPKLAGAARFMLFACWAGGLYSAIVGFCNWDKISDVDRGNLILSVVGTFGKTVESVPELLETAAWTGDKSMDLVIKVYESFNDIDSLETLEAVCNQIEDNWLFAGGQNVSSFFNAVKSAITTDGTFFGDMFSTLATIMKWMGGVVAAGFAALSIWQFVDDILSGASTTQDAFDGVIMAANCVAAVCIVVNLAVDMVFIPVLGAVAAVIGIIFALVDLFLPKPQPESPADKFMNDTLRPFITALPAVPANWTPPGVQTSTATA